MNIFELADILLMRINIHREGSGDKRWYAGFELCEIKDGGILTPTGSYGETIVAALNDFTVSIQGKKLVFNASSGDHRKEFGVPQALQLLDGVE